MNIIMSCHRNFILDQSFIHKGSASEQNVWMDQVVAEKSLFCPWGCNSFPQIFFDCWRFPSNTFFIDSKVCKKCFFLILSDSECNFYDFEFLIVLHSFHFLCLFKLHSQDNIIT